MKKFLKTIKKELVLMVARHHYSWMVVLGKTDLSWTTVERRTIEVFGLE